MRPLLFAFLLAIFCVTTADHANAQRRPGAKTPAEVSRQFDRFREQVAAERRANKQTTMRTNARRWLQSTSLSPTPENFMRAQVALAVLSRGEQPQSGMQVFDTTSLTSRERLAYFEALVKLEGETSLKGEAKVPPRIAIFDGVPANAAQFEARFGRPMTAADQAHVANFRSSLVRTGAYNARSINDALNSSEKFIVFIAHNEGGRIVNGEGQSKGIGETSSRCAALMKICIFIVCKSHEAVGAGGIGLVKKINVRRAGRLAADLADIAAAAQRDADGNLRFPIKAVHAMFLRVDREGGAIRLAGYRVGDWIVVRMIIVFPRCDEGRCP